ncbi:unnamed protein product [Leptidea sinapis]|uniref:RPA-interacting protein C-terminal domain-containing protein n=1 Tax=Leptidea sinapis TaxID=189913 RepID=A0A5E4QZQ3_9NEOP|nr:unnamed protein product [Leptidea sinapis]
MNVVISNSLKPSSPSYKNLKYKQLQSPVELKAKIRKDYRNKIRNCRDLLLNKYRGDLEGNDLKETLTQLYKDAFKFNDDFSFNIEEHDQLEEIKNEYVKEYDKSNGEDFDWSSYQTEENVICLICQKNNFTLLSNKLCCDNCNIQLNTTSSLIEIKRDIYESIERHNSKCNNDIQFSLVPEDSDCHIFLICDKCLDMQLVI